MIIQHGDEQLTVEPDQWDQMQASGMFSLWHVVEDPAASGQGILDISPAIEPLKRGPGRPSKEKSDAT